MDKKQVRVAIHNTIDTHCSACTKTAGMNVTETQHFCTSNCQIGKHLHKLGKMLETGRGEGKMAQQTAGQTIKQTPPSKIVSTKEDYLQFKRQGLSNADIAKKFGISEATLYNRIKVWGIKTEKKNADKPATPTSKHPPAFYEYLEKQGLKEKADQLRAQAEPQKEEGPRTPTQQEREAMFAPEQDKQPAAEPKVEPIHNYLHIQIPLVKGDHVGSYGMQVQERYERFGEHIDFTQLDRGLVFRELLQLNQAVLSWLQFDIGQLVVDEAERTNTLLKFIEHHNKNHIEEVLEKAKENGWEVPQG